jgi:hypothetical protein
LLTPTTPYRKELGDELVLKSLSGPEDAERLAAFQSLIHGQGVADMTRELILHHPNTRSEYWLYVEDERTGKIVSSICLIPWTLRYEGVSLRAGEMGIVATLEAYRHRGLVRTQAARHAELLREGGFDLSHIQGIPYFYRQFGYEYAMPLVGGWHVELRHIPDAPDDAPPYTFRQATLDDLPLLMQLYNRAAADLAIHTVRDEAEWRYLLGPSTRTEMAAETWLVFQDGTAVGYFRIQHHGFGEGLIVNEASRLDVDAALAALRHLKSLSAESKKPYIRLCLPEDSTLIQTARCLGAHNQGYYAWQIKLVDVGQLLRKLSPVLERRIAASPFAGLTRDVCLNLYREAFEMRFKAGTLSEVIALGFSDRGGIRVPPLLLAPLVLGYRSREELAQAHHDFSVRGEWQYLVDVLFPKMTSFLYTIY